MFTKRLAAEAIVVGLIVAILSIFFPSGFVGMFMLGVAVHLGCEFSGINKKYCTEGNACRT